MLTLDDIIHEYAVEQPNLTLTEYIILRSLNAEEEEVDQDLQEMLKILRENWFY